MRAYLPILSLALAIHGCAQMQKDLEASSDYSSGQTQRAVDERTGHKTTSVAKSGAASQPAKAPAPAAKTEPLGVSEADFQALHQHKDKAAPAAKGQMITLGDSQAYLSLPPGAKGSVPGVVLIHEWWGLNSHIKHWADRLAAEGYAAIAVDLYGGQVATESKQAMALMKAVDPAQAQATLAKAFGFLAEDPRIRAKRRASMGWCFGGGWSLQLALAQPVDAAVIYYGRLVTDAAELKKIRGNVIGVFGNRDEGIPPADVDAFEKGLKEAGVRAQVLRFDADHAFANPSSARYDKAAAQAAWAEVQDFLRSNLAGDK